MGIYSYPLFASVTPGTPSEYSIDTSQWTAERLAAWHSAVFLDYDGVRGGKVRWDLNEFMTTGFDCHKIYGYFDRGNTEMWMALFRDLYAAYPGLTRVAFHFFCSDEQIPFYITMDRGDSVLQLFRGQSESYKYFRNRWSAWRCKGTGPEFDVEMYRAAVGRGELDMRCVILDSRKMLW